MRLKQVFAVIMTVIAGVFLYIKIMILQYKMKILR